MLRLPDEVTISYLQESAMERIQEYKEVKMSKLGLEFVIQNHKFTFVDIQLDSSYIIFPMHGSYSEGCSCLVANLGSIVVRSGMILMIIMILMMIMMMMVRSGLVTEDMKRNKETGSFVQRFSANIMDQAYDKFEVGLTNMELLLAQTGEDWRREVENKDSKLFLLKPMSVNVSFKYCLIQNDPEFPVMKLSGALPSIDVCMEERRVLTLAEIVEDIVDPDEEEMILPDMGGLHRFGSNLF